MTDKPLQPLPVASHEVFRQILDQVSAKELASRLDISLSLIYKWAQPPEDGHGSGVRNPLDRLNALIQSTDDVTPVEWLARQSGGYWVPDATQENEHEYDMLPATNELLTQFAELLNTITQAASDQRVTQSEAEAIRGVWTRLKSYAEGFVNCCERGEFDPIRHAQERGENHSST